MFLGHQVALNISSYLLPDKGRSGKQKTGVVRRSGGSPVWGHTFVYKDVSLQELAERGLELTVWDHDRIASNEFLGGVRFNLGTGIYIQIKILHTPHLYFHFQLLHLVRSK